MGLSNQSRKLTTRSGIGIPGSTVGGGEPPPLPTGPAPASPAPTLQLPAAKQSQSAVANQAPVDRRVRAGLGLGRAFLWVLFLLLLAAGVTYLLLHPQIEAPAAADPDGRGLTKVWKQSRRATLDALEKVAERGQNINLNTLADQIPGGRKFQTHAAEVDEVTNAEAGTSADEAVEDPQIESTDHAPTTSRSHRSADSAVEAPVSAPVGLSGWPPIEVSAVVGAGRAGVAKINGRVVSVGETTADGVLLEAVDRGQAILVYQGQRRRFSSAASER